MDSSDVIVQALSAAMAGGLLSQIGALSLRRINRRQVAAETTKVAAETTKINNEADQVAANTLMTTIVAPLRSEIAEVRREAQEVRRELWAARAEASEFHSLALRHMPWDMGAIARLASLGQRVDSPPPLLPENKTVEDVRTLRDQRDEAAEDDQTPAA